MALTPVEIRHISLRKAFFGYSAGQVDDLLSDIVSSFEDVWRDRADLADKIELLEGELVRYRELEQLLRTTLISAERASQQMTDQARRETETVLSEARTEAREIVREALSERERLRTEVARVRAQLQAVLGTLEEPEESAPEPPLEEPPASTEWVTPPEQEAPQGAPPAFRPEVAPLRPPAEVRVGGGTANGMGGAAAL
jgi:cell division initiation protein